MIGRTFDTFGREWSLFLVLATPAAIGAVLQILISPSITSQFVNGVFRPAPTPDVWLLVAVGVLFSTLSGITGLASAVAADRLWRGEVPGIGETARVVMRSLPRAVPVWVLVIALQIAVVAVTTAITPPDPYAEPTFGTDPGAAGAFLLALPVIAIGVFVLLFIQVRLSLVLPVIALEEGPSLGVLPRTWRLTKGHAIGLFVISFIIGICVAATAWGASLFLLFGENRVIAGVALAIAVLVTAPLTGIWAAIAWGDLVAGRHADSAVMARGNGRWKAVAIVGGLGILMVIAGIGIAGAAIARLVVRS